MTRLHEIRQLYEFNRWANERILDVVATLSIAGALLLGQAVAGLVIVLMQTGGETLEAIAEGRASAAVRELEAAAPRMAHVVTGAGIRDAAAEEVAVGDELLVRPGELVPCDGVVLAMARADSLKPASCFSRKSVGLTARFMPQL